MNDNADGFFITRAELEHLREKLELVPDLVEEMAVARDGRARITDGPSTSKGKPGSRPPYPIHLEDMAAELSNELSTTIRDICETRGLEADCTGWPAGMAKWLIRYRVALAMMPQAPELFEALCKRIDHCARTMNHLEEERVLDPIRLQHANRQVMTGPQIERLAYKLGDQGKGLTRKRIDSLRIRHALAHTMDEGVYFYRLGDVIEAHAAAKRYRQRRQSA